MLNLVVSDDIALLDKLSQAIVGVPYAGKTGFILMVDEVPAGLAYATATPQKAVIRWVGVLPKLRGKGYGDFLTRVLMDHFSRVSEEIEAESISEYYLQFGFRQREGKMCIASKDLTFPHPCQQGVNKNGTH